MLTLFLRRTLGYRRGIVAYFIPKAFQSLTAKISFRTPRFSFLYNAIQGSGGTTPN